MEVAGGKKGSVPSGGTTVDAASRKTGSVAGGKTGGKRTAEQESGSGDPLVEGGGNQGTEKR